jgi:NAD dependent epimerase/dehydratase family enzyme
VAPHAVRQREFAEALGHVLGRPTVVPTPGFALKLAMGEASSIALSGQHVIPRAATQAGYTFTYPDVEAALRAELDVG